MQALEHNPGSFRATLAPGAVFDRSPWGSNKGSFAAKPSRSAPSHRAVH